MRLRAERRTGDVLREMNKHPGNRPSSANDSRKLAVAAYARQAQDRQLILHSTEIKLRAERRTGELLRETAKAKQRQGKGKPAVNGDGRPHLPTLRDLKITSDQAKDWQQLAALPAPPAATA